MGGAFNLIGFTHAAMDPCKYCSFLLLLCLCFCGPASSLIPIGGCYGSNECNGNVIESVATAGDCCNGGTGLSYSTLSETPRCVNCYDEESFTSLGTEFYLGFFNNFEVPTPRFRIGRIRLGVDPADGSQSTSFTLERLGQRTEHVAPTEVNLNADDLKLNSAGTRDRGIFIESNSQSPLSVVAYSEEYTSSDTFKVLPCIFLPDNGYEYFAVSVPKSAIPSDDYDYDYDGPDVLPPEGNSAIVIVSTEMNTLLEVTLTQNVSVSEAPDIQEQIGSDTIFAGKPVTFSLPDRMQTLYLSSSEDLTGSRIVSNKPIAFISGHECGTIPNDLFYCDQLMEQFPPTSTWGKTFITASFATRTEFDSFRVLASRDNTQLTRSCNNSNIELFFLNAGESETFDVSSPASCYYEATEPLLLIQFSVASGVDSVFNSDPFMVMVPPIEQYRSMYNIRTFNTSNDQLPGTDYINILLPGEFDVSGILFDNELVTDQNAYSIPCPNSEEICAYTVQFPISTTTHTLGHSDPNTVINAVVYWFAFRVGLGYFAGMTQRPVALPSVSMMQSFISVNESDGVATIPIVRSGDMSTEANVFVQTIEIEDSARAGEDFIQTSLVVNFAPNQQFAVVMIPLVDDVFAEIVERFEVFIAASPGVFIDSPSTVTVNIMDFDPPLPVANVSFAQPTLTVEELDGRVEVFLFKTDNAIGPVTVIVETMGGTALAGLDYEPLNETVVFDTDTLEVALELRILQNLVVEELESFEIMIQPVNGFRLFPVNVNPDEGILTVFIEDDDVAVIGFTQTSLVVDEREIELAIFGVELLVGNVQSSIDVLVQSQSGTAIGGVDYDNIDITLTLDSEIFGHSHDVAFFLIEDGIVERNESFTVGLFLPETTRNVRLIPAELIITIVDVDRALFGLQPLRPLVREGDGSARVTVTLLEGEISEDVILAVSTFNLDATGGEDYTVISNEPVVFSSGDREREVLISIMDDLVYEGPEDETFGVRLSFLSCFDMDRVRISSEASESIVSIQDNDPRPRPIIRFSQASYTTQEGVPDVTLLVLSDGVNLEPVRVQYRSTDTGTALSGSDYVPVSGELVFQPGETSVGITISILEVEDQLLSEQDEFFNVVLELESEDEPVDITVGEATVTIVDNDPVRFQFEQSVVTVREQPIPTLVRVTVRKTTITTFTTTVVFSTQDGDATAGLDYVPIEGLELTFDPFQVSRDVDIIILNDTVVEDDEIFSCIIQPRRGDTNIAISLGRAQVIIESDDQDVIVGFDRTEYNVFESSQLVILTVRRMSLTTTPVSLSYTTSSRTATSNEDFVEQEGLIILDSEQFSRQIVIDIIRDEEDEGNEVFVVTLAPLIPTQTLTIQPNVAFVFIIDDDPTVVEPRPAVGFILPAYNVSEGDGVLNVIVQRLTEDLMPFSVTIEFRDGSAVLLDDYFQLSRQLIFTPQNFSISVSIGINDDNLEEFPENFFAILTPDLESDVLVDIIQPVTIITIFSDEVPSVTTQRPAVAFALPEYTVTEGAARSVLLRIERRSEFEDIVAFAVRLQTQDASAEAGRDYLSVSQTVFFEEGVFFVNVAVSIINNDVLGESEKLFFVTLTPEPGSDVDIIQPVTAVTILDDDELPVPEVGFVAQEYSVIEGTAQLTVVVSRLTSVAPDFAYSILFEARDGTAVAPGDYFVDPMQLVFLPSQTNVIVPLDIQISIVDDSEEELPETFFGILTQDPEANFFVNITQPVTTITIISDEVPTPVTPDRSLVSFAFMEYTVNEEQLSVILRIERRSEDSGAFAVQFRTQDGSAQAMADYIPTEQLVFFNEGVNFMFIQVNLTNDALEEPEEIFFGILTPDLDFDVEILQPITTIRIFDGDESPRPLVMNAFTEYRATEGEDGQVFVRLERPENDTMISVVVQVVPGTAEFRSDYFVQAQTQIITFTPGVSFVVIPIDIVDNETPEDTEFFYVALSVNRESPIDVEILNPIASIIVFDDDAPPTTAPPTGPPQGLNVFGFNQSSYRIREGEAVEVIVQRFSESTTDELILIFGSIVGGTVSNGDFEIDSLELGVLVFNDATNFRSIRVTAVDDFQSESEEDLVIGLADPSGTISISQPFALISIIDNDSCGATGNLRLVGGNTMFEGRVEICFESQWRTVADSGWNNQDAAVVCRQLGYSGQGALAVFEPRYGSGLGRVLIDDVNCFGNESQLLDCELRLVELSLSFNNASVSCLPAEPICPPIEVCPIPDVQFTFRMDSVSVIEGNSIGIFVETQVRENLVEVEFPVLFRVFTTAGNATDPDDYIPVDRMESLPDPLSVFQFPLVIVSDSIEEGVEQFFVQLEAISPGTAVGFPGLVTVQVIDRVCFDMESRLADGSSFLNGRVEVCQNNRWGTVCDTDFTIDDATVVCSQLGFNGPPTVSSRTLPGTGPIFLMDVECTGEENNLFECGTFPFSECGHNEDAFIQCSQEVCNATNPVEEPPPSGTIECYLAVNCGGDEDFLTTVSVTECCAQESGLSFRRDGFEICEPCVVFGWSDWPTRTVSEQGPPASFAVEFLKGQFEVGASSLPATIEFTVDVITGTANHGDFQILSNSVTFTRPQIDITVPTATLAVQNLPDDVAQEFPETYQLRLTPTEPLNLAPSVLFLDTLCVTIMDADSMNISFTRSSFRGFEADGMMQISVFKDARIATPVTVLVQLFNFTTAELFELLPPDFSMPENEITSNFAETFPVERRDFEISPLQITFEPDESLFTPITERSATITIVDDNVNEATEELFVADITSVSSLTRIISFQPTRVAICRIVDNDPLVVGFEQSIYTFNEQPFDEAIQVPITREGMTEQALFLSVTVIEQTPDDSIYDAAVRGVDFDIGQTSQLVLSFSPNEVTLNVSVILFPNESTRDRAFQLVLNRVETSGGSGFEGNPVFQIGGESVQSSAFIIIVESPS